MPVITVKILEKGDPPPFEELAQKGLVDAEEGEREVTILVLEGGMKSGRPSVFICAQRDDGRWYAFETSAAAFLTAAAAVKGAAARWGFEELG